MTEATETTTALSALGEQHGIDRQTAREKLMNEERLPKFVQDEDGSFQLKVPHAATYLAMFGDSSSTSFIDAMSNGCANVSGRSAENAKDKNHALAIVAEIAPRDGIEAMLATQMAAVHLATMRESRLLAGAQTIQQLDAHEKTFNKLTRTFTAQMEALRKHRHGGKQTVTVQHVNVEDGGQAIVGNVSKGGGTQK